MMWIDLPKERPTLKVAFPARHLMLVADARAGVFTMFIGVGTAKRLRAMRPMPGGMNWIASSENMLARFELPGDRIDAFLSGDSSVLSPGRTNYDRSFGLQVLWVDVPKERPQFHIPFRAWQIEIRLGAWWLSNPQDFSILMDAVTAKRYPAVRARPDEIHWEMWSRRREPPVWSILPGEDVDAVLAGDVVDRVQGQWEQTDLEDAVVFEKMVQRGLSRYLMYMTSPPKQFVTSRPKKPAGGIVEFEPTYEVVVP